MYELNTNHNKDENKPIKVKILPNPFENSNLKNSEVIKVTEWIKKQSIANK